jgi:membrane-bound lytic murein transglycosylase B
MGNGASTTAVPLLRRCAAVLGVTLGALIGVAAAAPRSHEPVLQIAQPNGRAVQTASAGNSAESPPPPEMMGALSTSAGATVPALPTFLAPADVVIDPRISALAADGIPAVALRAYRSAADHAPPSCHLSWTLLAGIGRVESDHGRFGGAQLHADGMDVPHIIGIALDGSRSALIRDTDGGLLDGDPVYDHAVGPMQFIPSTWAAWGVDADGDGAANPFDINDAAAAAADYLCAAGGDLSTVDGQVRAVLAYNHSASYVVDVLALAAAYGGEGGVVALPLPPLSPMPTIAPVDPAQPPALTSPSPSPAAPTSPRSSATATKPSPTGTTTGTATGTATSHPSMTQTSAQSSSTATSAGATSSTATSAGATSSAASSGTQSAATSASASASSCPDPAPSTSTSGGASSSAASTAASTAATSAVDSSSNSSATGTATSTTSSPGPCTSSTPASEKVPVSSGIPALGAGVVLGLALLGAILRRRRDGRGRHEHAAG